jgi:hypothetical protein
MVHGTRASLCVGFRSLWTETPKRKDSRVKNVNFFCLLQFAAKKNPTNFASQETEIPAPVVGIGSCKVCVCVCECCCYGWVSSLADIGPREQSVSNVYESNSKGCCICCLSLFVGQVHQSAWWSATNSTVWEINGSSRCNSATRGWIPNATN